MLLLHAVQGWIKLMCNIKILWIWKLDRENKWDARKQGFCGIEMDLLYSINLKLSLFFKLFKFICHEDISRGSRWFVRQNG